MITIVEVPEYIRQAEKLLTVEERQDILNYLAAHPKFGDLIEGTGGIRKLRWGRGGRGKSGGKGNLLLPQRSDAALSAGDVRQE